MLYQKTCYVCLRHMSHGTRRDAKTCSAKCRSRLHSAVNKNGDWRTKVPPRYREMLVQFDSRHIERIGILSGHVAVCVALSAISGEVGALNRRLQKIEEIVKNG